MYTVHKTLASDIYTRYTFHFLLFNNELNADKAGTMNTLRTIN